MRHAKRRSPDRLDIEGNLMGLRIASLNAWGGKLHAPLMPYLAEVDADLLCLQEVVRTPDATGEWMFYRDRDVELPQRANLFDEVAQILPGHHAFFSPTARGDLFDGEDRILSSEFGLATYARKSLPVIGQVSDFIHGDFSAHGWGPHPRARNAHAVRVHDYKGDKTFTVIQLHGLRDPEGKGDTPARDAQADRLVELIDRIRRPGEALIVCGDFNLLPDSRTFDWLKAIGLTDLVTTRGFTDTRTSHYAKPGRYADYMLVSSEVEIARFDVVAEPEVSDHRALLLELA
jgi:endonuclease/exonuclease/phosphatase family metal-dependent hydrolase